MFGALRYDSNTDDIQFTDHTYGFLEERNSGAAQHSACDHCRSKKLRCSGQKHGCTRCKGTGTNCVYSATTDDGRSKRRKQSFPPGALHQARPQGPNGPVTHSPGPVDDAKQAPDPGVQRDGTSTELETNRSDTDVAKHDEMMAAAGHDPLAETFGYEFDFPDPDSLTFVNSTQLLTPKSASKSSGKTTSFNSDADLPSLISSAASTYMSDRWGMQHSPSILPMAWQMEHDDIDEMDRPAPLSLQEPNTFLPDTRYGHASESAPPATPPSCGCSRFQVTMLEELGSQTVGEAFDEVLSMHKSYLARCRSALCCNTCMAKSESVMLLVLVYERLVEFCSSMVGACLKIHRPSSMSGSAGSYGARRVAVGRYQIDSDEELGSVMMALTIYQVNVLGNQLLKIRKPASVTLQRQQLSKVLFCERKVVALMRRLKPEG